MLDLAKPTSSCNWMIGRSSSKQLPAALCPPQNGSWVQLPPCEVGVFDQCDSNNVDDSSDEASIAELSVKVFRSLPPDDAVACYTRFCNNAKACIKHYNTKYQVISFICLAQFQALHFYL